jgi:outer membrane protein, heavy metal efflux system
MARLLWRAPILFLPLTLLVGPGSAQSPLSWNEVRAEFLKNNPSLAAGETGIAESRADEITANLRPNPDLSFTIDQWNLFATNPYQPFAASQSIIQYSQLIERRHKRQLRLQDARLATSIAGTDQADLVRQLMFNLRDAFIRTLQGKSILQLAQDDLKYYDQVIDVNRRRYQAGDLARVDFDRIVLQRAQFESDLENAKVALRTAKIQLLTLMNDKRPVDTFEVSGPYTFSEKIVLPAELHQMALQSRGDILSATTAIEKAKVDHQLAWANGSTDPAVGGDFTRVGSSNTVGVDISIPLRIFDRNQGEKLRTLLDIKHSQQVRESVVNGAFQDIDTAYAMVDSVRALLRPYRDTYLPTAARVRDSISYSFSRGGSTLLDFLDAQQSYRDTELAYRNLIASYLSAVNQLNMAVGQEVMQ